MIGFREKPTAERVNLNEDPETRELNKKKFYNILGSRYFLPPITTKGITREYLVKVHRNEVYTVSLFDLRHFEVELTMPMMKRVGIPNNSLLVRKLDGLLMSQQLPTLGFDDFEPPDEVGFVNSRTGYTESPGTSTDSTSCSSLRLLSSKETPPGLATTWYTRSTMEDSKQVATSIVYQKQRGIESCGRACMRSVGRTDRTSARS